MMSKPKHLCCNTCFERIAKGNTSAARLWLDLCSLYIKQNGLFVLRDWSSLQINYLENLGFITTTETGKDEANITVRVNGYTIEDFDQEVFCISEECHDGEETSEEEVL